MNPSFLLPLAVVLVAAFVLGSVHRRVRPSLATWALTGATLAGATAAGSVLVTVALEFAHGVPLFDHRLLWCVQVTPPAGGTTWALGAVTVTWSSALMVRVHRRRMGYRALQAAGASGPSVEVMAEGTPTAFSLPGRPGRIIVSESMLAALSAREQEALFAHERSHLSHRHDRFIHVADLASDVFPPLRWLATRVRYATERWADEDAVLAVGDRRTVATAVAHAALAQHGSGPPAGSAMAGSGVRRRVEALTGAPPRRRAAAAGGLTLIASALLIAASSTVQVHHLATVVAHVCPMS